MTKDVKIEKALPSHTAETSNLKIYHAISITCFVLAGLITLGTMWFTYNYTFNTIDKIQTIGILRTDLQIKPINFKMYEIVLNKRETKISTSTLGIIANPFTEITTTTPKR